jgi:hypothetical protein
MATGEGHHGCTGGWNLKKSRNDVGDDPAKATMPELRPNAGRRFQ